jgi:hypothetical protein
VSSVGLLVGAIAGSFSRLPHQAIAMAMSVGAGLLLAGVSIKGSGAVTAAWGSHSGVSEWWERTPENVGSGVERPLTPIAAALSLAQ